MESKGIASPTSRRPAHAAALSQPSSPNGPREALDSLAQPETTFPAEFPKGVLPAKSPSSPTARPASPITGRPATLHGRKRSVLFKAVAVSIVILCGCIVVMVGDLLWVAGEDATEVAVVSRNRLMRGWNTSMSVWVSREAPLAALDDSQRRQQAAGSGTAALLSRAQLPSWTLRVVAGQCVECLDSATHAAALKARDPKDVAAELSNDAAADVVMATPRAPLGLAGPMLFAMSSVTDDVDVAAELPRWSWVPRSYAMRRQFDGAAPPGKRAGVSPYLVVMGIPSTDQPIRASLRDAQRDTWLAYTEVARSGNDFHGALLPLYIFAAAERDISHGVTDMSPLLPTVAEYEAAATGAEHVRRRVVVMADLGSIPAGDQRLTDSPCGRVATTVVGPQNATALELLSSALSLPVTPAFTAPAEFICHASTALWQEALAHRNVLWVDMMTDRKPTSGKKIGQGGGWGMAVEVGMTQKLVLWLEYAYHAFPDVPYIMKCDDDTYMKVPQFLSDIRYIRGGYKGERVQTIPTERDPAGIEQTEECIYWGNKHRGGAWSYLLYHTGSGYMMQRRLIQAVLEPSSSGTTEMLKLATTPYSTEFTKYYKELIMNVEDAFMGRMLRDNRQRIREVCPFHYAKYVEEMPARHSDTHMGRRRKVGWPAVMVHHCTPADEYYIHYYFQHEHEVAAKSPNNNRKAERAATNAARKWLHSRVPDTTVGLRNYAEVAWTRDQGNAGKPSFLATADNVTVYHVGYKKCRLKALDRCVRSTE